MTKISSKYFIPVLIILFSAIILKASSANSNETADSLVTIQGFFKSENQFFNPLPALFYKDGSKTTALAGKIIHIDSSGMLYGPTHFSIFYDPPEKFFRYEEIIGLLDSANRLIYGTFPAELQQHRNLQLSFQNIKDTTSAPVQIQAKPNQLFDFKLEPGYYIFKGLSIKLVLFNIEVDDQLYKHVFSVSPSNTNYFGDFILERNIHGIPEFKWNKVTKQDTFYLTEEALTNEMDYSPLNVITTFIVSVPVGFFAGIMSGIFAEIIGDDDSEYGSKQVQSKLEMWFRFYF